MNRFSVPAILLVLLLIVLSVAACDSAMAPQPTPAASTQITNILWQWRTVTNPTTGETVNVPNPEKYTITFKPNGTFTGKADCNTFSGTYSQTKVFTIKLGPTTQMACPEGSLDRQYLTLLSNVAAAAPDGEGGLAMATAGNAQRVLFKNGGMSK